MKILAIGAHPDDIEIFMYGFLSICKENGHSVSLTIATDGSLGGGINGQKLAKIRKAESIIALKKFQKPVFLNIPDALLGESKKHFRLIRENIEKNKPQLIITHYKKDYHSDHIALSKIVKKIAGHYIPILFCDTMMGLNFNPDYYFDISKHFNDKIKSILFHKSQDPKRFVNLVKLMNSYRAAQCNSPLGTYAEAYMFEKSFPFSDIREILPSILTIRPFHIENSNGFL